jgi:hypothetical protein
MHQGESHGIHVDSIPCGPPPDAESQCHWPESICALIAACRVGSWLTVLCMVAACRSAIPRTSDCVFPAPPRSTIAWGLPSPPDSGFSGHVFDVRSGGPIDGATVQLEPGGHIAQSDSSGAFRFHGVSRRRYSMRALALGFHVAQDSVTFSEFGVAIVAVLAPYTPDLLECVRPATRQVVPQRDGLATSDSRIS